MAISIVKIEVYVLKDEKDKNKVICANEDCPHFSQKAVGIKYPSSAYCSLKCKYTDKKFHAHNETYGD